MTEADQSINDKLCFLVGAAAVHRGDPGGEVLARRGERQQTPSRHIQRTVPLTGYIRRQMEI